MYIKGLCNVDGSGVVLGFSQLKAGISSRASPCQIFGRLNGTETGFSASSSVSPVNITPPHPPRSFSPYRKDKRAKPAHQRETARTWFDSTNRCS